jgi:5-amino-6-(5-phosphoribosylamino)uracil reductase
MVASVDGATVWQGRSGGLSSRTDQDVLNALRATADMVLVGAGTVRAEGYGPPRKEGLQIGVVTATGNVNTTTALFTSGAGFLVTTLDTPTTSVKAVRAGFGQVDLRAALAMLPAGFIHVEGGPTLNAALLGADLVDEVNLTVSPALAGGDGPRVTQGAGLPELRRLVLAHVCEDDGYLFLRYVRAG